LAALRGGQLTHADPGFTAIIAIAVLVLADHDAALPAWEQALGRAQRLGSLDAVSGVHMWRGWTWFRRGELREAEDSLRLALEVSRLWNPAGGSATPFAAGPLASVYLERGEVDLAAETLDRSGSPAPGSDGDSLCRQGRIQVLLARGALAEAIREADSYASSLRLIVNPGWAPWRSLKAEALARDGRREDAEALMQEELALARQWGAPGVVGRSLRLLGSLRRERGIGLLRDAVEKTAESPARLEHAKALAALGVALRHATGPAHARGPLRRALDLADRCGATQLSELIRAELLAAGVRPRHRALLGPASLTPSERRVVDLAAEGRANRDIAETLYVTPKTVEVHLSSAYRKLGIQSRHRLRAALEAAVQGTPAEG
jgi:DNA-binding CsgD family transcriptional regulator